MVWSILRRGPSSHLFKQFMTKLLECVEIESAENVEYSVIWLHGLGASGHDFEPIVPELNLLSRPGIRFLFPHAPIRPITINGGASMRGWFDIDSLDFNARNQDNEGITESVAALNDLIENEHARGIPEGNIVLAGFSQGGAIALQAGLTLPHKCAGILALSTYLPMSDEALAAIDSSKKTLPVFMAHGTHDDVIQSSIGAGSRDRLAASGIDVEWHEYAMPHSVSQEEVQDMSAWLKRLFGM